MGEFYSSYPGVTKISWEPFNSYLMATYGLRLTPDKVSTLRTVVKKMETFTPTIAYDEVIKSLIERDYLARIADECAKARDGTSDLEAVNALTMEALQDVERYVDKEDLFVSPDISGVVDRILSSGYEWRAMCLNRSLGLLRPGDFLIVAARVEVGKTTFLASEASFIAPQLPKDRPLVWINNEEKSDSVFFRVVQSALGKTTKEILADRDGSMKKYDELMGTRDRIRVTDGKTNDVKTLSLMLKELNPGMIIIDQLDKVTGFTKESEEHLRLGSLYKWARELSRDYGPVIVASQLSEEADHVKDPPFIGFRSLRGSKTDKPGEADAIITIGKWAAPSPEEENLRTINVPKNKLPGNGKYYVESERHGKYIVRLDQLRARYEG
tara:strand:- start:107 stop:1255 length:1149 start_codon:yes stop_codon:yes gene_type:complete